MIWFRKISLISTFALVISCSTDLDIENDKFYKYLNDIEFASSDLKSFDAVLIIPMNKCSNCVAQSTRFASNQIDSLSNVLFIFNEIHTIKPFKIIYGLDTEIAKDNVRYDQSHKFGKSGLDFGNVGFYILKDSKIIQKEIINSSIVNESLESLKNIANSK